MQPESPGESTEVVAVDNLSFCPLKLEMYVMWMEELFMLG